MNIPCYIIYTFYFIVTILYWIASYWTTTLRALQILTRKPLNPQPRTLTQP